MRIYVGRVIAVILLWLGLGLMLYPTASSWVFQYNQADRLDSYSTIIEHVEPNASDQLAMARKYNDALKSGANLLPGARFPQGAGNVDSSLGLWPYSKILQASSDGVMGRIQVPAADVDLPIYHGSNDETLLKGAGHLEGTSLPVGGEGTRTVITAHRGLASATMFTYLDRVKAGDTFTLNVFDQVMTYRVIETKIVEPDDTDSIRAVPGKDLATLITCTPLGINTQRILVTGERVVPTPVEDEESAKGESDLPKFPWWAVGLGAALLAGLAVIVHSSVQIHRVRRASQAPAAGGSGIAAATAANATAADAQTGSTQNAEPLAPHAVSDAGGADAARADAPELKTPDAPLTPETADVALTPGDSPARHPASPKHAK